MKYHQKKYHLDFTLSDQEMNRKEAQRRNQKAIKIPLCSLRKKLCGLCGSKKLRSLGVYPGQY